MKSKIMHLILPTTGFKKAYRSAPMVFVLAIHFLLLVLISTILILVPVIVLWYTGVVFEDAAL